MLPHDGPGSGAVVVGSGVIKGGGKDGDAGGFGIGAGGDDGGVGPCENFREASFSSVKEVKKA